MLSPPPLPSDRSFGITFVLVFALLTAYAWWTGASWTPWPLGLAALTLAITLVRPKTLAPLNRLWMKLAALLNLVVSPVVMGIIFFGIFTPVALFMRVIGRDTMHRRFNPKLQSYWVERTPPGPDPKRLPDQF